MTSDNPSAPRKGDQVIRPFRERVWDHAGRGDGAGVVEPKNNVALRAKAVVELCRVPVVHRTASDVANDSGASLGPAETSVALVHTVGFSEFGCKPSQGN